MGEKHKCPVCGKHEMEYGDFEICPFCRWENDPLQLKDPDYKGGANTMSLNQAREMYRNGIPLVPGLTEKEYADGIATACLYELQELFGEYLEELKGKKLTEFEKGQQLAYEQIMSSVNMRINHVNYVLSA